ncbi:MAG TPA: D-amino acid dehydrogenase [Variovorax sp.]|nr:D-amino acid dehydrogenase [Variovorax sp.]
MHICVLGAGIVGLATAWQLRSEGHDVTVVDRAAPGSGASRGNGAQLSYSYVAPLADPAIWGQLPHLLLSARSPLKIRLQADPAQWRWCLAFLAACNARTAHATTARLLALAASSRSRFDALRAEFDLDCDFSASGKLVLYRSRDGLAAASRQMELQRAMGSVQRLVTPRECVEIEPALDGHQREIAGAIYTQSDCAADCFKVCLSLWTMLEARGVRFVTPATIEAFEVRRGRVESVRTDAGAVQAEAFVVALGGASARVARQLGVRLPVYPLKGYSITLDVDRRAMTSPTVSVTDSARKIVFAGIGSRLRVAGMAELVGDDDRIPADRIRTLVDAARAVFPRCGDFEVTRPWTGMRPATPTGLPITGRVRGAPDNVLFNTGHGALGFTLAFGSAVELARAIARPAPR